MADARPPVRVLSNKTITAAGTGDTDLFPSRGAKALYFIFSSSASQSFAAANAFQLLVVPAQGMAETGLSVATAANHELSVPGAATLNSKNANAGIVVGVFPANSGPAIGAYKIGARLTAGGSDMTDVDVDVVAVY